MTATRQPDDEFGGLESADDSAVPVEKLLPDPLAFDTDSKRQNEEGVAGIFGGFFLADDCNAERYHLPNAPREPKGWLKRVNGSLPSQHVPGIHTPRRVRFALVAEGDLRRKKKPNGKETFLWQAIVLCNEIFDRETNEYALLKLTVNGVVATKLFNYMVSHISKPCAVITEHFHAKAREAFDAKRITEARLAAILQKRATAQMFWIPVRVEPGQRMGLDPENSTMGALPIVDKQIKGNRFETLWPQVPKELLTAKDAETVEIGAHKMPGLLLPDALHAFCRDNRDKYRTLLREVAAREDTQTVANADDARPGEADEELGGTAGESGQARSGAQQQQGESGGRQALRRAS